MRSLSFANRVSPLALLAVMAFALNGCSSAGVAPGDLAEDTGETPGDDTAIGADGGDDTAPVEDTGTSPGDTSTPPKDSEPRDTGTTDTGVVDTGTPLPDADPPPVDGALVNNLAITDIALYQGVRVSLVKAGVEDTSRTTDVIANREGLIRVFVEPKAGWATRLVTAELNIAGSGTTKRVVATLSPSVKSSESALTSTFNFNLPEGALATDSTYSVKLTTGAGQPAGDSSAAAFPATGTASLRPLDTGDVLKIKLVPVRYGADASKRLPDTTAAQVELYRKAIYQMYPARRVEITVREPFDYSATIGANGSGWSAVLQAIVRLRQTDRAPADMYYHGIFAPSDTFSTFCSRSCVSGLCGLLTSASDSTSRACVGLGFTGDSSAGTMAHEIGHAHGRGHAPCGGVTDYDGRFPYSGGAIGSWGYDVMSKKLVDPAKSKDFMGYCSPSWISDYSFQAIAKRMSTVLSRAHVTGRAGGQYRFVDVSPEGVLTWGDKVDLNETPSSDPRTVSYTLADGTVQTVTGSFYGYEDLGGGYLLVPEPPASLATSTISGFSGRLPAVMH